MSFYGVELLYERPPEIDGARLLASVRKRCPAAVAPTMSKDVVTLFHEDHVVQFSDGTLPVQTVVMNTRQPVDMDRLGPALEQSWAWPKAKGIAPRCQYSLLVNEMFGDGLEPPTRLALFQRSLLSVIDVIPCAAIHWVPAGQVIDPLPSALRCPRVALRTPSPPPSTCACST